ncbi:MAG TPA: superoxide dismutase family protein [Cerasibacillus sp.]|uniref:superoxide dismutase family protein n=1 Tax=Cerasibacillus sp. TaxID=2498711 RepID=UPI002F41D6E2
MRFIVLFVIGFLTACSPSISSIDVDMYNASGDYMGKVMLSEGEEGVLIKLKVEGFTPGFHGIHIHEFPKCDGPDFKSAGNHLNPEGKKHGLLHPDGSHLGDLPNVEADGSGLIDTEVTLSGATLKEGKTSLLKGEGTSLIITEGEDDGMTQPSGESGARLVCGKIIHPKHQSPGESPSDPTEEGKTEKKDE